MNDGSADWRPLVTGKRAQEIAAVIEDIAAALAPLAENGHDLGLSLGSGHTGMAVFFHYLSRWRPDDSHDALAQRFLENSFACVQAADVEFDLYAGICGVAWAHEHLYGATADDQTMEEVDRALIQLLSADPWPGSYDLIGGLAGMSVYALEHWPRGQADEILSLAAAHLVKLLQPAGAGSAIFTPPDQLPPHLLEKDPEGYFNVGVAHGMPAVAVVLAAAGRLRPEDEPAVTGAREIARWLLDCPLDEAAGPLFPRTIAPDGTKAPSRLAWCYGDAGVAGALLAAARSLGDQELAEQACAIARRAADLDPETCGVLDGMVCHGAGGLTHIFNRFWQATGEDAFRQAAELWLDRLFSYRQIDQEYGGFRAMSVDGWYKDPGFLVGSAGIGLVLLGLLGGIEPAWDRVLTLSAPAP